jgi:hypothetical protein
VLNDEDGAVNEPDIPADVNPLAPPASNVVTLVENEAEEAPNAPVISVAICAELDNVPGDTEGLFSNVDTLVLNDDEGAVNDPDIIVLVNTAFDSNAAVLVEKEELTFVNDPDISVAI